MILQSNKIPLLKNELIAIDNCVEFNQWLLDWFISTFEKVTQEVFHTHLLYKLLLNEAVKHELFLLPYM